jgi:RHH-type transcriptional regulator, rel operon repressor / antitoxin RelB
MDDELEKHLKSVAKRAKRKQSDIMRAAIAEYLEEIEDYLDAVDALQELDRDEDQTVSLEELLKHVQS